MREFDTATPAMSHSPAYYTHHHSPKSSSPFSSTPQLQRPPPAQVAYRTDRHPQGRDPMKASMSSATSGSTDVTDPRSQYIPQQYTSPADLESGYTPHRSGHHAQKNPAPSRVSNSHGRTREMEQAHPAAVVQYIRQQVDEDDEDEEDPDHAIWILFWMSLVDPFYSLFSCLFSIVTLLLLMMVSPIRLCQPEWSFSTSLIRTICPVYRKHLQLLCADSVKNAHNFEFSPGMLVVVHVLAPIISICMAFFSWIAAIFWLFAITMGNPDGTERRDDGRATVLMARNKWERYLLLALRRQ